MITSNGQILVAEVLLFGTNKIKRFDLSQLDSVGASDRCTLLVTRTIVDCNDRIMATKVYECTGFQVKSINKMRNE